MGWSDKLADLLRLNDGDQAYVGYPQMQVGLNQPRQAGATTGFLEGATGLPSMQPKNPITDPNYEAYEQGKNTGELANIAAMAVPAYASVLRAGAPKAYNALENYMVKSGGMIPLEAWHGTPHKIENEFDIKKVGTGEGNQSFGHGMYFAENPAVATQYRDALSDFDWNFNGKPYDINNPAHRAAIELKQLGGDTAKEETIKRYEKNIADLESRNVDWAKEAAQKKKEELNILKTGSLPKLEETSKGNLYKVDIPDEHIATMLDWDKPINKQSEFVQNVANELLPKIKQTTPWIDLNKSTGGDFYRAYTRHRGNYPDFASEGLLEKGVKGIKYKDEGSRYDWVYSGDPAFTHAGNSFKESGYTPQQALEGMKKAYKNAKPEELQNAINDVYGIKPPKTHNFVVFEPSKVKILEENGIPTRKDLIQQQVDKLE
jgi:hypothetical protein